MLPGKRNHHRLICPMPTVSECVHATVTALWSPRAREHVRLVLKFFCHYYRLLAGWFAAPAVCSIFYTRNISGARPKTWPTYRPTDQQPKEVTVHAFTHVPNQIHTDCNMKITTKDGAMMMVIYGELWDICLLSEKFDGYIKELGCLVRMALNHSMRIKVVRNFTDCGSCLWVLMCDEKYR